MKNGEMYSLLNNNVVDDNIYGVVSDTQLDNKNNYCK